MARYIDADKAKELWSGEHPTQIAMRRIFDELPTADVVPKSEVDLYRKQVDELEDELASTYDKLEKAKAEVAREIFEEIDKAIYHLETPVNKYLVINPNRLAELKKKYIARKSCADCTHFVGCECFSGNTCDEYEVENGEKTIP